MNCLFENPKGQPKKLKKITDKYIPFYIYGTPNYKITERFLKEVEKIGYNFEYGLDNEPFNLKKI